MSLSRAELLEATDAIYATVLDASKWTEVMDRVNTCAGAQGTMLVVSDPVVRELEIAVSSAEIGDSEAQTYVQSQLAGDELRWNEALDRVPALTILDDDEIWSDRAQYDAMPSVRWLRQFNRYNRSAVRLCAHGGWSDSIAAVYSSERSGMTRVEAERLGHLLPHLARAIEIRRPFTLLKWRYRAILSVLDRLGLGVFILLADDHVLFANEEAERVMAAGDAFRRKPDGKIALPRDAADRARMREALATVRGGGAPIGTTVYLKRAAGLDPYVVEVAPIRDDGNEVEGRLDATLVCVIDPERRDVISTRGLEQVYGLTEAEASVCALIGAGYSNRQIAEIRGVHLDTVKSQSKAIYRKTRCKNRVELVQRALSIAPPLLDEDGQRED